MIRGRHHDHLDRSAFGIRQEMKAKFLILFFDIGGQIKIDFNPPPFILENTERAEADTAAFRVRSACLCIRCRICFYQGFESSPPGHPSPSYMSIALLHSD